ncbi:MAG: carbohydrate ABC transporter permease [Gammaproteobacteria bacterium]
MSSSETRPVHSADQDRRLGWAMLSPAVLYIVGFIGVPFVLAILLSFSNATVGNPRISKLVGLENYISLMHQPNFLIALENSILITFLTLILLMVLATILSELLALEFRFKKIVQTLLILPWAMPVSLAAIAWLWLLDSQFSPVDWMLAQIGILGPGGVLGPARHLYYLGRDVLAIASVVTVNIWRLLPLATVIVLAGRLSIPQDRFDQAKIDGAGFFRILFHITVPALMPVLTVAILFTALVVFGDMTTVALLTRGGPGNASQILPYWAFLKGIQGGDLAGGAAVALFMLPVLLVVAILALRIAYRSQEA